MSLVGVIILLLHGDRQGLLVDTASVSYAMSRVHRGTFIIISNKNFAVTAQLPVRRSADNDVSMLQDAFSRLGFHVVIHCDRTARQMIAIIAESTCSSVFYLTNISTYIIK